MSCVLPIRTRLCGRTIRTVVRTAGLQLVHLAIIIIRTTIILWLPAFCPFMGGIRVTWLLVFRGLPSLQLQSLRNRRNRADLRKKGPAANIKRPLILKRSFEWVYEHLHKLIHKILTTWDELCWVFFFQLSYNSTATEAHLPRKRSH